MTTKQTLSKILTFLNHERYQVVAALVCLFLLIYGLSCQSSVTSITDPQLKITRDELTSEVETFIAKAERKYVDLDRQDELKALLFDKFMLYTQTGVFNPIGILPTIFAILGVGAITDNVRKRKVIRTNLTEYVNSKKTDDK